MPALLEKVTCYVLSVSIYVKQYNIGQIADGPRIMASLLCPTL